MIILVIITYFSLLFIVSGMFTLKENDIKMLERIKKLEEKENG